MMETDVSIETSVSIFSMVDIGLRSKQGPSKIFVFIYRTARF
jgi:hypothetical protein